MSRVSRLFQKKDGPKSKEAYQSNDSEKAHPSKLDQYYTIPELTTQEEDRMISHLAEAIVSYGMDVPAVALLTVERPVSTILSQTLGVMVAPFAELIGVRGYDYVALFNKKENVNRLIAKIEELREKTQEQESKRARERKESVGAGN